MQLGDKTCFKYLMINSLENELTVKQGHPEAMDQGKGCPVLIEFLVNSKIYILNK